MSKYAAWKSFEREVTKDLVKAGFDAKRNWNEQFVRTSGVDVMATDGESELLCQLKYGQSPNLKQAYKEAAASRTNKRQVALGITRLKGTRDTLVTLKWIDLLNILKGAW